MPSRNVVPGDAGQPLNYTAWAQLLTTHLATQGLDPQASSSRFRLYFDCGYTPSSAAYAESILGQSALTTEQVH